MKASIKVIRDTYTDLSTIGKLYINDTLLCETLEDRCRDSNRDGDLNDVGEAKVHSFTAIPSGKYKIIINMSNRFKKLMPLLIDVKGFEGIRIHSGNVHKDTEGCIIVGLSRAVDSISQSKIAFMRLMNELGKYTEYEIEIIDKK